MPYQVSSWQFSESFDEDLVAVLVEDLVVNETLGLLCDSIVVLFFQCYDSRCSLDIPLSVAC